MAVDLMSQYLKTTEKGELNFTFNPKDSGIHEVFLKKDQQDAIPIKVYVGQIGNKFITAYGEGLFTGNSGEKNYFRVSRAEGLGEIEVKIKGPEKCEVEKKNEINGIFISYFPLVPGNYQIDLKISNKNLPGSPFIAKISGQSTKKTNITISESGEFPLPPKNVVLAGLIGYIKPPSGLMTQASLKINKQKNLTLMNFNPNIEGKYIIDITKNGHKLEKSPFTLDLVTSDLCNPGKVKVNGKINEGLSNQWNEFKVDWNQAGYGELTITIEGPFRVDLEEVEGQGHGQGQGHSQGQGQGQRSKVIRYKPPEPGNYILGVKYGSEHVKDSPFIIKVGGKSSGRVREIQGLEVEACEEITVGKSINLQLSMSGCSPLDMEASLTSPSGNSDLCEIRDKPGGLFLIKIQPNEKGKNILSLKLKGIHINGSPLPFSVGIPNDGGSHKVEFGGVGVNRGVAGIKNEFNIYTREAGSGFLQVSIDGPSKSQIKLLNTKTGFVIVSYQMEKEGEYTIGIKYDGIHIPHSPFKIQVDPDCPEAKKITLHALRDRGLEVDKVTSFSLHTNGAKGDFKGYVLSPSGNKTEVDVENIDTDEFMIKFTPKENGLYYIGVKFNNCHIPSSPVPMLVGRLGADPAHVILDGKGLRSGNIGSLSKFTATTVNAGSGPMNISIEGPSKVAISCTDMEEGYEISYTPTEPGDYFVYVKFCNVLVPGCPYIAKVTGSDKIIELKENSSIIFETQEKKISNKKILKGDSNKVQISGPGLKKAFAGRPANFNVDIKDAGFALLTVGVVTPKGLPLRELTSKKLKPGIYNYTFTSEEKGDHQLVIRYGQEDVPGFPCILHIN